MKLDSVETLYVLSEQQQQVCNELEQYDIFFNMLRHDYLSDTSTISTMHDVFLYYYYEEQLIYNSELTMIYLLRHFVVETVRTIPKFDRIKMRTRTIGSFTKSLFAAVLTVNLFIDIKEAVLKDIPKKDIEFMLKYSDGTKVLFQEKFGQYDSYPRKLVKIQTAVLQKMRHYFFENEKEIELKIIEIIQFMDQYTLDEKDIFERGMLK